jgi:hypothetical protein
MAGGTVLNKQPIFTGTPLLITSQFDPEIPTNLKAPGINNYTVVYEDASVYGSLITKVTVCSTGLVGETVTTKVIYLGIIDAVSGIASLYQSKIMTGISGLTANDAVPYVTFEFGGGLVMNANTGYQLVIAASTNAGAEAESGDQISVTLEGGTYDQPPEDK